MTQDRHYLCFPTEDDAKKFTQSIRELVLAGVDPLEALHRLMLAEHIRTIEAKRARRIAAMMRPSKPGRPTDRTRETVADLEALAAERARHTRILATSKKPIPRIRIGKEKP